MTNPHTAPTRQYTRGSWGTAVWIDDCFCRIRLKNKLGSLMVNTIVYKTPETLLVIDPGWPWTLDALTQSLIDLGVITRSLDEVSDFLYTHTHIDHMGGAALLSASSTTPHHYLDTLTPHTASWHAFQDTLSDWDDWMISLLAGPHRERTRQELEARGPRPTMTQTFGPMSILHAQTFGLGETLRFGELELVVHDASGHDPHHVAFFDPTRKMLIAGDAALAVPTPITEVMGDDLTLYEATLDRLEALNADVLLPGHGTQVMGAEQVTAHIQRSRGFVTHYKHGVHRVLSESKGPVDLWSIAVALRPDEHIMRQHVRWWAHIGLIRARLKRMLGTRSAEVVVRDDGPYYAWTGVA